MNFVEFFIGHFIELFLIIGFFVCSLIFKLYKNKKCFVVYFILLIESFLIVYDGILKSNLGIDTIVPIIYLTALNSYALSLIIFPLNKKNAILLFTIFLVGLIASLFVEAKIIVMAIVDTLYFVIILVYSFINHRNRKNLFESMIAVAFSIINILCIYLQLIYPSTFLLSQMVIISTIVIFISEVVLEYNALKVAEEKKIQTQRTSIAISQIQPHFLYNSLATIGYICKKDAIKASEAIDKFSDYLRANLNSLRTEKNIPFTEELSHVETYLWLEKLRFQNRLEIVYDIGVENFLVPPLSVQPLVENAVKHGICEKLEGGTLYIRTIEYNKEIKIIIEDTGIGFDPKVKPKDGKTHVGIENVRSRIKSMANGSLIITSEIGKGTISTITLPKEDNK